MKWLIFIILIHVMFGKITQNIYRKKGYDGGFLWGLFLGIIGVIIVLKKPDYDDVAVHKKSDPERERDILSRGGWRCKSCGQVNSSYMSSCVCGRSRD